MDNADKSSRTEEATFKRRQKAYKEGNFPKTQEIGVVFVLIAAFIVLLFQAKNAASYIAMHAMRIFSSLAKMEVTEDSIGYFLVQKMQDVMFILLPLFIACFVAAILAGGLQSGFRLTPKVLEPKFSNFNPVKGLKNIFSVNNLVKGGVDILKFIAVGLVILGSLNEIASDPIFYTAVPVSYVGHFILKTFLMLLVRLIIAIGIIAIISYMYQRHRNRKDLMMTKQEVKDEKIEQEGNPMIKREQRLLAKRLLMKQMIKAVPTADVVVTNPTHYAVALKYETGKDPAPIVLAKGKDMFAKRIKKIAKEHQVPMVENKAVAHILFKVGEIGEAIPAHLYEIIADILTYVYRTHRYYFHRLKVRRMEQRD